ncbi:hypothetical protein [Actinocrispum sp. NPDC049592]|uniref:hypothetical protein n=1 Tax=Actinocrispum sp. NPDC049592 TaxID=3154835 RepID=UPI00342B59F2
MRTLVWQGGELYDVSVGWYRIDDGEHSRRSAGYGSRFDAVTVSPRGDVVALTDTLGTKALLVSADGNVIREFDRSYYYADRYRYPLALFTLPDGRTGLAHCPDDYNRLEIEVAETGERLTEGAGRKPADFFHSRLAVSASGRYLLSAGWIWHPLDTLAVFDLHHALAEPESLDVSGGLFKIRVETEIAGACFVGDEIVVSTPDEPYDDELEEQLELEPNMLAGWSPVTGEYTWRKQLDLAAGDLVPLGGNVLALYDHPRLFGPAGELIQEWPDLATGTAQSSIVAANAAFSGPARIAIGEDRFAVTDGERVTVVHLER